MPGGNLERHLQHCHILDAERIKAVAILGQPTAEATTRAQPVYLKCPQCSKSVMVQQMKTHFLNAHRMPLPKDLMYALGEPKPINRFKSDREREAHWRRIQGALPQERTDDVFDRQMVVSGGAYGLGKKR